MYHEAVWESNPLTVFLPFQKPHRKVIDVKTIDIPYGKDKQTLHVPLDRLSAVITPNHAHAVAEACIGILILPVWQICRNHWKKRGSMKPIDSLIRRLKSRLLKRKP